ncbi:MAG: hypothetical protein HRU09_03850 [Oligoflexales bacterium]|nr:hypothetical protein [Oligoflexales bacterium]
MKKLILLFRKLQFFKFCLVSLFFLVGACTSQKESDFFSDKINEIEQTQQEPLAPEEPSDELLYPPVFPSLGRLESQINVHPAFSPDGGYSITPKPRAWCSLQSFPISLNLPLILNLKHETKFVRILGPLETENGSLFEVDFNEGENKFWIPATDEQTSILRSMLCQDEQDHERTENFRAVLGQFFEELAPDCKFSELAGEGFVCELASLDPESALSRLKKMQKDILRKWRRQPYLFLRRLTITRQLAQLLLNRSQFEEVEQFCSLLSLSHAKELPLVMRSTVWREGFCQSSSADSFHWGEVGIEQATRELSFFQKLLDKSNRLGQLKVQIPRNLHKTKELWVQIQPDQDVADQVLETALSMNPFRIPQDQSKMQLDDLSLKAVSNCWNPLYHNDYSSLSLASLMLLSGSRQTRCYLRDESEADNLAHTSYLCEGIIGETSFVVDNGRYKILHLPMGTYNYTIVNLPPSSKRWAPLKLKDQSKGAFAWSSKRPRPKIKTW